MSINVEGNDEFDVPQNLDFMANDIALIRFEHNSFGGSRFRAVRLKAHAAFQVANYRPRDGGGSIRPADAARLDKVVEHYAI